MYVAYHHSSEIEYISENLLSRFFVGDPWALYTSKSLVVVCVCFFCLPLSIQSMLDLKNIPDDLIESKVSAFYFGYY